MVNKKIMLLAPGMVLGALVLAADGRLSPNPAAPEKVSAETFENVGRQAVLVQSGEILKEAHKARFDKKYADAIAKYRSAKKVLSKHNTGSHFTDRLKQCEAWIAQCYYEMAGEAMKKADSRASINDFEDAIRICKIALEYCKERREELNKRIEFYEKRRDAAVARYDRSIEKLKPNHFASEYNIQLLIEQGIVLLKRNELMAARRKFEEVLLLDPYNETAVQNLLGVNTRLRKAAEIRANATARHLTGEVEWAAALPVVMDRVKDVNGLGSDGKAKAIDKERSPMLERLQSIKFPSYNLVKNVKNFAQVMQDLEAMSRTEDPQKKGVNFVIRLKKHANPRNVPKMAGLMTSKPISLLEILTRFQERGDLTFKVDDHSVIIAEKGVPLEKMTVRTFKFSLSPEDTEAKLKDAMKSGGGVSFGEGASLTLVPVRNEIVSKNTPINQRRIENWIALRGGSENKMVQVMFKFLEVAQNDLDELGFSWQYARRGNNMSFDLGSNSLLRHYANDDANDRFDGAPVPSNNNAGAANINGMGDPDSTYGFAWRDRKNALIASVYALDWADSSDILYSPRVTTLNNTVARVDMTEKHYYPGEYEDIDNESTEKVRVYVTNPQPTLDDERDLGIKFTIKPEINGHTIRAIVDFDIKQFDSWLIVDSRNLANDDDDGEYQKKAVINTRRIYTDVTLKDGDTVLIGSIAQDLTTQLHDKIPILGDLPLIGRLFQSRYTVSKKNNLLVFMTCKIIGPDGSAAIFDSKTGDATHVGGSAGLPTFPRNL